MGGKVKGPTTIAPQSPECSANGVYSLNHLSANIPPFIAEGSAYRVKSRHGELHFPRHRADAETVTVTAPQQAACHYVK
jgi:hypothetical protein